MKDLGTKAVVLGVLVLACSCSAAAAAAGPTASPTSLAFAYTAGSGTTVKAQTLTVTLPASLSTQTLVVTAVNSAGGWLAVSPSSGSSPLALTVSANPTTLDPGSHPGSIVIDTRTGSGYPLTVLVSFVITAAAPTIQVLCNVCNPPLANALPAYATGSTAEPAEFSFPIFVASSGDAIPFSVTAANAATKGGTGTSKIPVWLRVAQHNQPANVTTGGVALSGSFLQIDVTVDKTVLDTLDPVSSPFNGTITVSPTKSSSSSSSTTAASPIVVGVNLQVTPGPPGGFLPQCQTTGMPAVRCISIFPSHLPAVLTGTVASDPSVVTITGDNFFAPGVTSVSIGPSDGSSAPTSLTPPNLVWISRNIMQVTIASGFLKTPGVTWDLTVQNGSQAVLTPLYIDDPSAATITSVVSAASFLSSMPTNVNDYPHVSPREIISIFGRNLGPASTPVLPTTNSGTTPLAYPSDGLPVLVEFLVGSPGQSYHAPLIMMSPTQINCVVPHEVDGSITPVFVQVTYNNGKDVPIPSSPFQVTPTTSHPGVFTSGGAGLGQAAVLNFDSSTGALTVNSSSAAAPRSSAVSLYVTGMGDLQPVGGQPLMNGLVSTGPVKLVAMNPDPVNNPTGPSAVNVNIDGQPAVVTYAGAFSGGVAGLVQINAIVPLAASASKTDSISVSVGASSASQPGVWLAVK